MLRTFQMTLVQSYRDLNKTMNEYFQLLKYGNVNGEYGQGYRGHVKYQSSQHLDPFYVSCLIITCKKNGHDFQVE